VNLRPGIRCFLRSRPSKALLSIAFASLAASAAPHPGAGALLPAAPPDPAIAQALAQVSPDRIRQSISTLVSFHTRNTLTSMETNLPPDTGVTAAAHWIAQQFREISEACHGCLEVKTDTFTQPADPSARSRVKAPTTITNVYAILRGSDPAQSARMYLVTGHYDSINSNVFKNW
jgi:hypothetical protein